MSRTHTIRHFRFLLNSQHFAALRLPVPTKSGRPLVIMSEGAPQRQTAFERRHANEQQARWGETATLITASYPSIFRVPDQECIAGGRPQ